MIKEARGFGPTIDEAKENAIANLNPSEDEDIQFEVIATPKKKTFGLFGGHNAEVRVFVEIPDKKPRSVKKPAGKSPDKTISDQKNSNVVKTSKPKPESKKITDTPDKSKPDASETKPQNSVDETKKPVQNKNEFGEMVDASLINPETKTGKAIAYLNNIFVNLGCTEVNMKVAEKENCALIDLEGKGLGVVIGRRGETLDSLQYLAGLAANNGGGYYKVSLNIGNYRQKREETLISLATRVSNQVLSTGKNRTLEPMNPYERRIIHTTVQNIDGVYSSSVGEGSGRRVVIAVEGSQIRPPRHEIRRREGFADRKPSSKPSAPVSVNKEPKKDSDIPLYGKFN